MSTYTAIQYIRYRLKAKNRHGIHSPFVYGFIEQVLENDADVNATSHAVIHGAITSLPHHYQRLVPLILNYCKPPALWVVPINDTAQFIAERLPTINVGDVVILTGIHTTAEHTAVWAEMCHNTYTRLSIDLYGIGLLFYRKEFKERQHFVLKY